MKKIFPFVLTSLFVNYSYALDESSFYSSPNKLSITKNLVTDYNVNNTDNKDDTPKLQKAIDDISNIGGGKLFLPKGKYVFIGAKFKSNVHIEIAEDAVIHTLKQKKSGPIFSVGNGKDGEKVENFSLIGLGNGFKVDLTSSKVNEIRVVQLMNAENFLISNVNIFDKKTKFSSITMNPTQYKGKWYGPVNGIIKDIRAYNTHYGYGVTQIKAGVNILFKNLYGQGGVNLRLETGSDGINDNNWNGLMDKIVARDIICEDGNAAVMISPHSREIGSADVRGVHAKNCGFAVRMAKGYVAGKHKGYKGIKPGTFAPSIVEDVTAEYGQTSQLKSKHFKYIPCELRHLIKAVPNTAGQKGLFIGPSATAMVNETAGTSPGSWQVSVKNVTATGFIMPAIVTGEDAIKSCPGIETPKPLTTKKRT